MAELANVKHLSKLYGVHVETVRAWVRKGRIPCLRPTAKTIRFNLAEVERALSKPTQSPHRRQKRGAHA